MTTELRKQLLEIGVAARDAAQTLAVLDTQSKNDCLMRMAASIEQSLNEILEANTNDIARAHADSISGSFLDRLTLNESRVIAMANGIREIAALPDPVGQVLATTVRPNGLQIDKVATPIGVIGVIFESRPNVTADATALCLKAGNAVVLRGGSAAITSNMAIRKAMAAGITEATCNPASSQLIETVDRDAVGELLSGLAGNIDVIVPRGGKSLVARVQKEARVPVFAHLEGVCHTYIHKDANRKMATAIALNAKMRRTGICGATETLLVDQGLDATSLKTMLAELYESGCEIRGDAFVCQQFSEAVAADEEDWSTEYLSPTISVKSVADCEHAIQHISRYGSNHTDAIVTDDKSAAERFLRSVDSAIVMHNASTQFADGGEFGMGAEIGIATGKLHARGPVGVEQLTTFKYVVRGSGQTRG